MEPQTTGYIERGILSSLVTWDIQHERYEQAAQLPTSQITDRVEHQTMGFGRGKVAAASVRRALSNLRSQGLVETVPPGEMSDGQRDRHPREKFWRLTTAGFFEVHLLHQAFNEELRELYRRFGSGEWGHEREDSDGLPDCRHLSDLDYGELQTLATQFDIPANQSGEQIIEQLRGRSS